MKTTLTLPLEQLQPAPWNPRGAFTDASVADLVESIRAQDVLVPLLVRAVDGHHEIIAGHRRARAAALAGLTEVPVRVGTFTDDQAREVAIVDNLQREDIRPIDEARSLEALQKGDGIGLPLPPAAIAARIGKPERYVWDRLRLLQLIPDAQMLLASDRITVQHAIVLAKLTPEHQERVIDPLSGGLFTHERNIPFDEEVDGAGERKRDPYRDVKPVSIRELQHFVATHVRFDPVHAILTAPLDFGPVIEQIETAEAQRKRCRKVIHITRDHYVQPDARAEERTFCANAWKRADGREGSTACDRAVLGVVVVGPGYGDAFHVCVHKDCDVHWLKDRLSREKYQAKFSGGGKASTRNNQDTEDRKARERQEREEQARQAWEAEKPAATAAFGKHVSAITFSEQVVRQVLDPYQFSRVARTFGVKLTKKTAAAVLLLSSVELYNREVFDRGTKPWKFIWKPKAEAKAAAPKPAQMAAAKATTPKKTPRAKGKKR